MVQKYGGTSVGDVTRIRRVADRVAGRYLVVVFGLRTTLRWKHISHFEVVRRGFSENQNLKSSVLFVFLRHIYTHTRTSRFGRIRSSKLFLETFCQRLKLSWAN